MAQDWKEQLRKSLTESIPADSEPTGGLTPRDKKRLERTIRKSWGLPVSPMGRTKGRKNKLEEDFHERARSCLERWYKERDLTERPPYDYEMAAEMGIDRRTYRGYKREYGDPVTRWQEEKLKELEDEEKTN